MKKKPSNNIDVEIDKLTDCIENVVTGDIFETKVLPVSKLDLKQVKKGNGWKFDWRYESSQSERELCKLTIIGNEDIIQGLISYSDQNDHYFMHLIENAPFNQGKNKIYTGVPGNLVAYLCKRSWDNGYEGFVAFIAKTKLVNHYEKTLGAVHIGGHKMIIFPKEALKLIKKYYKV